MTTTQHDPDYIWWNGERVDVTVYDQDAWQPAPEDIEDTMAVGNHLCVSNRPWFFFECWLYPNGYHISAWDEVPELNIAENTVFWNWVAINCDDDDPYV